MKIKEHATLSINQYTNLVIVFGKKSRQVKEYMQAVKRYDPDSVTDRIYTEFMHKAGYENA